MVRAARAVVRPAACRSSLADRETGLPLTGERQPVRVVEMMEAPVVRMLEELPVVIRMLEELPVVIRMLEELPARVVEVNWRVRMLPGRVVEIGQKL